MKLFKLVSFLPVIILTTTGCANPRILPQKWYVELNSNDVGLVRTFMNFEISDTTFTAYSRKNADRDVLGIWTSLMGRLFTNDFKNGSLLHITHGKVKHVGDTLLLSGIFQSAIGSYYFKGNMIHGLLTALLTDQNKTTRGRMSGTERVVSTPLSDYPTLIEQALTMRDQHIYNTTAGGSEVCKKFDKKIRAVAQRVQDDVELEFAFFYYAGKLPFTHFSLLRIPPAEEDHAREPTTKQIDFEEKTAQTAYMKIRSFEGTAAEIDSAFQLVIRRGYTNLVVDLRGNPGGNIEAGMEFARWVSDSIFYGGVFLTQKWFAKHSSPPQLKDYSGFPHFTESNFDLLITGIHNKEGLCLQVIPEPMNYRGKLYILTDGGTASTCEPIAYGLKQRKRAVLVGEKTAGAMLNGEFFKLKDGFSIIIPTADYYASDGYRIDRQGVLPSINVKSATALDYVMMQLIGKRAIN